MADVRVRDGFGGERHGHHCSLPFFAVSLPASAFVFTAFQCFFYYYKKTTTKHVTVSTGLAVEQGGQAKVRTPALKPPRMSLMHL